ncbi:MAG: ribonuclease domain-containing protein [Acidaminococcaceae bacterium]
MKKMLGILLSVLFLMSLFTGCSKQDAKPATAKNVQQTSTKTDGQTNATRKGEAVHVDEKAVYTSKWEVAAYLNIYKKLPVNFITMQEATKLGWQQGTPLEKVAPGKSLGGDVYKDVANLLPAQEGRTYKECDLDYAGGQRTEKRLVYSNDGLVFYTSNLYQSFKKLF